MAKKHFFRFKRANEILSTMIDNTLTRTHKINDFTDGSVIKTLYEAFATEIEMFYYLTIENIKDGVWNSVHEAFDFGRKPELKAYGDVVVTFSAPLNRDITIPKGVKFTSSKDYYDQTYETLTEYAIKRGSSYARLRVVCTQGGVYGNIPNDVLDTASHIANVVSVTNPEAFSTGQDEETLAEVRVRFREYIQALQRGTVQALEYGAQTVPRITGAYVDESPGYVRLYVHDANGDLGSTLQKQVIDEIEYWRPAGIPVAVFPIHKTTVDINVVIDTIPLLQSDRFREYVRSTLSDYLNTFQVHQLLDQSDIVQQVMNISDLGILGATVDLMVYPDAYMRGDLGVDERTGILLNGRIVDKTKLVPKDRAHFEGYIVSNLEDKDRLLEDPTSDVDHLQPDVDSSGVLKDSNSTSLNIARSITTQTLPASSLLRSAVVLDDPLLKTDSTTSTIPTTTTTTTSTTSTTTLPEGVQSNGGFLYRVNFANNKQIQVIFNKDSIVNDVIYYPDLTNSESEYLRLVYVPTNSWLVLSYYRDGDLIDSTTIKLKESGSIQGYVILNNINQFSIRDTKTSEYFIVTYNTGTVEYQATNGTKIIASVDRTKQQKTVVVQDASEDVETTTTLTLDNKLVGTIVKYHNIDGTYTTIQRNEKNDVIRTIVTDQNGKVLSDTGATDSTTTTAKPVATTTTTTITAAPTTTITTTLYPFKHPKYTSSTDAPETGYLPVFSRYLTGVNELLKAGKINVYFKSEITDTD